MRLLVSRSAAAARTTSAARYHLSPFPQLSRQLHRHTRVLSALPAAPWPSLVSPRSLLPSTRLASLPAPAPYASLTSLAMASATRDSGLRQRPTTRSAAKRTPSPSAQQTREHSHHHHHGAGDSNVAEEAEALMAALKGRGADRGSRITLLGLVANVGLTAVKGAAGYVLGSAVLLADAAHSGSDLIADVVTLVTYRLSMRPSSISHPYGYGKYETLGSLGVATLLIATALAIGAHSYHSLLLALMHVPSISPELIQAIDQLTLPGFLHDHGLPHDHHGGGGGGHSHDLVDEHGEIVDIRAAWFAGLSVVLKEWLYRATLKVAKETHSNVLLANAFHHRSDSFGSLVALGAIAGSWAGFPVLDPIGGLLVSGMILKNGFDVGVVSLKALVDQVTDPTVAPTAYRAVAALRDPSFDPLPPFKQDSPGSGVAAPGHDHKHEHKHGDEHDHEHEHGIEVSTEERFSILAVPTIRVFTSGPSLLIDIELVMPGSLTLDDATRAEQAIQQTVSQAVGARRVREVVVRFRTADKQ